MWRLGEGQDWAGMFRTFYRYSGVFQRHATGPLAKARSTFLSHLARQGAARSTLLGYASQLRAVACLLEKGNHKPITGQQIADYARSWAQERWPGSRAQSLEGLEKHFTQVASAWCRFMGWLVEEPQPTTPYAKPLQSWTSFLRAQERLAESSVVTYLHWTQRFLQWLPAQGVAWRGMTLARIDEFMEHLGAQGLQRATLASAAKSLRRFACYAHQRGWCRQDLAPAILSPRLFRHEDIPCGPAWPDVKRLIEVTAGTSPKALRNRAILLLLAVYGLRSGEVCSLRLEDLDWSRKILRVQRNKSARVQEYPLTTRMAQALDRYLKKARPEGFGPQVFLRLQAPYRPLTRGGLYALTRSLMDRLAIVSPKRGPHSLRHACASYLLSRGLSLKGVGDHLGHRSLSATQIYAKVDLKGLRTVAAFDLGGLV